MKYRWTRIRLEAIRRLLGRGWAWREIGGPSCAEATEGREHHLLLVSPRGVCWKTKLDGGHWMRRAEPAEQVKWSQKT